MSNETLDSRWSQLLLDNEGTIQLGRAMRRRWMETQEMIAKWKSAAEKLKPSRRRKSPPPDPELPF
jgi:hypothetical protein